MGRKLAASRKLYVPCVLGAKMENLTQSTEDKGTGETKKYTKKKVQRGIK
jgi:hypothetical protein